MAPAARLTCSPVKIVTPATVRHPSIPSNLTIRFVHVTGLRAFPAPDLYQKPRAYQPVGEHGLCLERRRAPWIVDSESPSVDQMRSFIQTRTESLLQLKGRPRPVSVYCKWEHDIRRGAVAMEHMV
jgi:hypothetical protein